jgi:uncharacterized protein HemY
MRHLRHGLLDMIARWDTPTRLAMSIAVTLLFAMFVIFQWGSETWRVPAFVGIVTLTMVINGLVLWGNRRMVTPFTKAQRYYLQGDFEAVIEVLTERIDADDVDVRELTLLGNTYRQMGNLSESEQLLFKAVNISPQSNFPLYGFGRTLLVKGDYQRAAEVIQQALDAGASDVVRVDLAETFYRNNQKAQAVDVLRGLSPKTKLEPHRALMKHVVLQQQPSDKTLAAGLTYWEETMRRFAHTPYGVSLAEDVRRMKAYVKGEA